MTEELLKLIGESVSIETALQNPEIEQKQDRKSEINISYSLEDHTTQTIELIPYDTHFYILRVNHMIEFAVKKEPVMNMFSKLGTMIEAQ